MPEPRQRWRLVLARDADAPTLAQRDSAALWVEAMESTELPLHRAAAGGRPKVAFGAPLTAGMAAEAELLDLVLTERWPTWRVRAALGGRLPPGWRLVDLYDVWLAGPPLAGRVAAADYRIELEGTADDAMRGALSAAAHGLLDARRLPRERPKGDTTVAYDLRPLLVDVSVSPDGPRTVLMARTRFHPELGTGRPEEVAAALGEAIGHPLSIASIVRARLVLAEELAVELH